MKNPIKSVKNMNIKKNISLIIGISLPVLLILIIAASIYIPTIFMKPKFSFLYVTGSTYSTYGKFYVVDGILQEKTPEDDQEKIRFEKIELFKYDVGSKESYEITFQDAARLSLKASNNSPDDFTIERRRAGNSFFSYSGSGYDLYLRKGSFSKRLKVKGDSYKEFLAWIVE